MLFKEALFLNINYLRNYIKDIDFEMFKYSDLYEEKEKFPIHSVILDSFCKITSLYGVNFIIGINKNNSEFDPSHDSDCKAIKFLFKNRNYCINTRSLCAIFSHELAHSIQYTVLEKEYSVLNQFSFRKKYLSTNLVLLSELVLFERAAERLAYFIYNKYFGHNWKLRHTCFSAYKSKKDILSLHNTWGSFLEKEGYNYVTDFKG